MMKLLSESFDAQMSGYSVVEKVDSSGAVSRSYYDAFGTFMGKSVAKVSGAQTTTQYFDSQMEAIGKQQVTISDRTVSSVYDAFGQVLFTVKVLVKPDYTLTETFDSNWASTGFVKEIHTATQHGVQTYGADSKLISAHLESDNGQGVTKVEDYGPDFVLISGTTVTKTAEYTVTENFGAGRALLGYVKEIHTPTQHGVQIFGADGKLVSAHLESDNGHGVTKVEDYGPAWFLVASTTVTTTAERTITEYRANGAITGGTVVTPKADFTLTETYGAGWTLLGYVKEIHTATTKGTQTYGADDKLISAHLESDNGHGVTKVEDYGPDWFLVASKTVTDTGERVITEYRANGAITGGTVVTPLGDYTLTETYGAGWTLLGYVKELHSAITKGTQVYGADDKLISAHLEIDNGQTVKVQDYGPDWVMISGTTVTTKPDFTLTETYGAGGALLGFVKEIHTATQHGVQTYGADSKLISAHLESDNGHGVTKVEDYGPDWFLVASKTVTDTGERVITEYRANGAITGGTVVTPKADFTLTETYGAGWTLLGYVKEIHTATTKGTQTYGADDKLISAHLESDNGHGVTKVEDYGPDWFLVASKTVTDTGERVITEYRANGAITGGTVVTPLADYTLTETYGPGWTLQGYVKELHSATQKGTQTYGADDKLISAHLEIDNGHGVTKVQDYGAGWVMISGTTVTTMPDYTVTETFGAGGALIGYIKEIHTAAQHGVQVYGADGKLVSAHLESDNGHGVTKVEDYGPDWFLVASKTVNDTGERVITEYRANGAITGGTVVTPLADYTLTETYGAGWTLLGYVKAIHTGTQKGTQTYGADDKLISAHLETDNGQGYTKVQDYGPGWVLVSGTTVTVKPDYTLTETFGAGGALLGFVKEVHTATQHGTQTYGADSKLISAHLESDNGLGYTKVEDYGADWVVIERTTVKVDPGKVTTEHTANGVVDWMTIRTGADETAQTQHVGYAADNTFVGDIGKDIMKGDAGNDHLYGMGNNDDLSGGLGDDYLDGGAADDKLAGNDGLDTLIGGSGNDTLDGGAGADILIGGLGRDVLTGGAQGDKFVFTSVAETGTTAATRDYITDFLVGADKIDLSAIDANGVLAGDPAFQFTAAKGAAFSGAAGALIWSQFDDAGTANDRTFIYGDINGDKVADFGIELYGLHNLTQADFVL